MRSKLSNIGQQPFAPLVWGLELVIPPERRVAIGRLARPITSYAEYAKLDLPVVIGQLAPEQQRVFAALASQPEMRADANTNHTDVSAGFGAVAKHLTDKPVLQALRPVVSDILQFDRDTFKDKLLGVELYVVRDTPGPDKALAPDWHRDKHYGVVHHNWSNYFTDALPPRRYYTVRSAAPMELIRDQAGATPAGRALMANIEQRTDQNAPSYQSWLREVKAAGFYMHPKPFDVVLTTGEATLHKSHRPDEPTPSAYLQIRILTEAEKPPTWRQRLGNLLTQPKRG